MKTQTVQYNNHEYQVIRVNEEDSSLDISLNGSDIINCKQEDVVWLNLPEPITEEVTTKNPSRKTPKI